MKSIATLLVVIFIAYLYYTDLKDRPQGLSKGIIVSLLWWFSVGTQSLSYWLYFNSPQVATSAEAFIEGNPIDRNFYFALIILGIIILYNRRIDLKNIVINNKFVFLYFLLGLISILWSDYPFITFKRLIKAFGNIIMVLIVLTEKNPEEAFGLIFRLISYFFIPVSVLFIKYYPELGRAFSADGTLMFTGLSSQKNGLGRNLLLIGIYYLWNILYSKGRNTNNDRPIKLLLILLLFPLYIYLFSLANSATSLMCLFIGVSILFLCKLNIVQNNRVKLITRGVLIVLFLSILEFSFDLSTTIIQMLGRDPSLTDRIPIWELLLSMVRNPIIGTGFESFWLGERMLKVWSIFQTINQSHNGYLETYLNLGLVGLTLLIFQIISGIIKIKNQLVINYSFSVLKLAFLLIVIFYNWTEASLHGLNIIWLIFFICIMQVSPKLDSNSLINKN